MNIEFGALFLASAGDSKALIVFDQPSKFL
jgi:hypothetical protein